MMDNLPAAINWESELRGAAMLVKSGLTPKDIKTAEAALFCIMAGRDLGLSPVQSLRSIRPVMGKIEASADLQLGLYHRQGGKSRWLKLDANGAELELSASWLTSPHVSKFGIEDARRADLMSQPTYRKYPAAMFRSRAITQGLKDIGFLAGAGVYAPGELGGAVVVDASGEVLPASEASETAETPRLTDGSGLAGVVESLPDQEREELANTAQLISDAVRGNEMESALNYWHARDNDQKLAIWAMMDKDVRKAITAAKKSAESAATTSAHGAAPSQEGAGAQSVADLITPDQAIDIADKLAEAGIARDRFLKATSVESIAMLPAAKYARSLEWIAKAGAK
jgi:hypothetical protein